MHNTTQRKAIAMIELIFAIVIMGIVMLSAPMLIDRAQKSSFVTLQQEAIAAAAAQMNIIMTAEWDHFDTNNSERTPVLLASTTTTGTHINTCNATTNQPKGVTHTYGRYCLGQSSSLPLTPSTTLGTETGEGSVYNDIDDFNNKSYTISIYNSEAYSTVQGDYIDKNMSVLSRVYYGDDIPKLADGTVSTGGYKTATTFANPFRTIMTAPTTSNIKLISVTLTSNNTANEINDKKILLTAFMCNIGATKRTLLTNRP